MASFIKLKMRVLSPLLKTTPSSSRWIARQKKDPYVRKRSLPTDPSSHRTAYRSRSSFKLLSLSEKYPTLLRYGSTVVDLGAAPGGWSQVAVADVGKKGKVFAVDLLEMQEIEGVEILKGDFLSEGIQRKLYHDILGSSPEEKSEEGGVENQGMVDTVLSDMMAAMSGVRDRDIQASLDLVTAATIFAKGMLRFGKSTDEVMMISGKKVYPGGNLVLKFFQHPDLIDFRVRELDPSFSKVMTEKPKESRSESSEAYWVCLGFKGASS